MLAVLRSISERDQLRVPACRSQGIPLLPNGCRERRADRPVGRPVNPIGIRRVSRIPPRASQPPQPRPGTQGRLRRATRSRPPHRIINTRQDAQSVPAHLGSVDGARSGGRAGRRRLPARHRADPAPTLLPVPRVAAADERPAPRQPGIGVAGKRFGPGDRAGRSGGQRTRRARDERTGWLPHASRRGEPEPIPGGTAASLDRCRRRVARRERQAGRPRVESSSRRRDPLGIPTCAATSSASGATRRMDSESHRPVRARQAGSGGSGAFARSRRTDASPQSSLRSRGPPAAAGRGRGVRGGPEPGPV